MKSTTLLIICTQAAVSGATKRRLNYAMSSNKDLELFEEAVGRGKRWAELFHNSRLDPHPSGVTRPACPAASA